MDCAQTQNLGELAKQNTPTRVAALSLVPTEGSVRSKTAGENISLKLTKQTPYDLR